MSIRPILLVALLGALVEGGARTSLCAGEPSAVFVMKVDGSELRRVAEVDGYPNLGAPRWSHDGTRLTFDAARGDSIAHRWFLINADGSGLRAMGPGAHADWSPDDKQLVFGVGEKAPLTKGIWVQNGDGRGRLSLAEGGHAPRWSPQGGALAFIGDKSLEILDMIDGGRQKLKVPSGVAAGFDWSPDGKQLAFVTTGSDKNELWIVDVSENERKKKLLTGDIDGYLAWSPDGKRLAIAHARQIHLINVDGSGAPQPIPGQKGNNRMPAWSGDGQRIAFASTRQTPALRPVARAKRALRLEEVKRHTRGNIVYGLALSLDGRRVLLGGKQDLEIWNMDNDETSRLEFRGEWVALSPDGHSVALCGPLVKIALGNIETGKPVRDLPTGSMCTNVEFSPDGKRVVCGTIDKQALVWDVASGKRICVFEKHDAPITRVAFLPGGQEVASNGQDKVLRIWNAETARERLAIPHPEVVWGLAVSPDGQLIATGTGGHTEGNPIMQRVTEGKEYDIRLWDAATGELVRDMKGHTNVVYAIVFSPDGRTLLSGGWDGTIRLWDVATGDQLASVQGQGSVFVLAVTPDGGQLVVGGGENRLANANIRRYPGEQVRLYRIVEEEAPTQSVPD